MNYSNKSLNYLSALLFVLAGAIIIFSKGVSFVAFAFIFVGVATALIGEVKSVRDDWPVDWELYKRPVFILSASLFLFASLLCAGMEVYLNEDTAYLLVRIRELFQP